MGRYDDQQRLAELRATLDPAELEALDAYHRLRRRLGRPAWVELALLVVILGGAFGWFVGFVSLVSGTRNVERTAARAEENVGAQRAAYPYRGRDGIEFDADVWRGAGGEAKEERYLMVNDLLTRESFEGRPVAELDELLGRRVTVAGRPGSGGWWLGPARGDMRGAYWLIVDVEDGVVTAHRVVRRGR